LVLILPSAEAWDSGTHRLITRLAIGALAPSPLAQFMYSNDAAVEDYAVAPDTVLKQRYGEEEARRHYVDLEYFGPAGLDAIKPDLHAMERKFGKRRVMRAGTLPWTIEDVSTQLRAAWERGDCARVLMLSGYLSHYLGDMSQPLHTTKFYDGYLPSDRGMHARLELAVDQSTGLIGKLAKNSIHVTPVESVWQSEIAGLRQSNALIDKVVKTDRAARMVKGGDELAYQAFLMSREQPMIEAQIADSASRLASIWQYEWDQAGHPAACASRKRH
jgi:hypothetical protein